MLKLVSEREQEERAERLRKSLEEIYGVKFEIKLMLVPLSEIRPNQTKLEREKLELVKRRVISGWYVPPVLLKTKQGFFVLDGHHRVFVARLLKWDEIQAYVLVPEREVEKKGELREWSEVEFI